MGNKKLTIERKMDGDKTILFFRGVIDENADLKKLFSEIRESFIMDLEGIEMINSAGVREWVTAISKIPSETLFTLEHCSPRIVEQLNYVSAFPGHGQVVSFFAPYFCSKCKTETTFLLEVKTLGRKSPQRAPLQKCVKCKGKLEFDDVEDEYFAFIQ